MRHARATIYGGREIGLQNRLTIAAFALSFGVGLVACILLAIAERRTSLPPLGALLLLIALPAGGTLAARRYAAGLAVQLDKVRRLALAISEDGLEKPPGLEPPEGLDGVGEAMAIMAERLQRSQAHLHRMAFSDLATGLPNHERFVREVSEVLAGAGSASAALAVIRLDRLDRIFDAFGQEAGDEILQRVVSRMRAAVRSVDRLVRAGSADGGAFLARLRGGEFAVLAPNLSGDEPGRFVQLLVSALNQPFEWRDNKLVLHAEAGAVVLPQDGADPEAAIRRAMLALSSVKGEPTRVRFFSKALDREAAAALQFEREMRTATERGEFRAFFQPKVDLLTGRMVGAEALARWVKPDKSMVSPGKFIPVAEEVGLIGAISEQILKDAIWKAAGWARDGFNMSVAINISPLQFADERFADKILRIMEEAGAGPDRIELEITESMALDNPERATRLLEPLRSKGVKVALDDFGCGHSSLATLTRLPFDILKIDQQFVRALSQDRHAPAIIETILAMAASLNYEVVAEGIETEREAEFLRRRGCMIGQGFLYGAAMPAQEFIAFAEERMARAMQTQQSAAGAA